MDTYYIDGKFVGDDRALISVKDIVVLRSFGVFDFLITYNKRPFHLEEHVQRLENSARCIGLEIHHTNSEICEIVQETVKRNHHHMESAIRIMYSGGISSDGLNPDGRGILMVMVTPRLRASSEVVYRRRKDNHRRCGKVLTIRQEHILFIGCARDTASEEAESHRGGVRGSQ